MTFIEIAALAWLVLVSVVLGRSIIEYANKYSWHSTGYALLVMLFSAITGVSLAVILRYVASN